MIRSNQRQSGFSLTEMLIATAIMAVGLVMIATIFPVGVKLTGMSAERSIAAVAADEAFAKIGLYGMRDFAGWPTLTSEPNAVCTDYLYTMDYYGPDGIMGNGDDPDSDWPEFQYPSAPLPAGETHKYHWSALCRQTGPKDVQVTVFIATRTVGSLNYYELLWDGSDYDPSKTSPWPAPVPVDVQYTYNPADSISLRKLTILPNGSQTYKWDILAGPGSTNIVYSFIQEGYTIVNNRNGKICRVLEKTAANEIVLYDPWQWDGYDADPLTPPALPQSETIWVVPPGVGSDRYPCVGVFQRILHVDNIN